MSERRTVRWVAACACLLALGPEGSARAANGNKPRTTPDFGDVPCMVVVDRDVDPIVHLEYEVSSEDTELSEDEVPDSRRHQFFAFGQQRYALPWWISESDVDAAAEQGLVDPDSLAPSDILEESPQWLDVPWVAINENDERRPITFEAASEGLDWDTTSVPAGAYVVAGYVWEPPVNVWSRRQGVFKVVDGADGTGGPAAYLESPKTQILDAGDVTSLSACVDAMAASTLELQWAPFGYGDLEWRSLEAPADLAKNEAGTEHFEFEFRAPGCTSGGPVTLRLVTTDPVGRTHVALLPEVIVVLHDESGAACEAETSETRDENGGEGAGRCRISNPRSPWRTLATVVVLLGLWARRRRGRLPLTG